jgi:formylglycine-generating enzyme required for sulfatase activity
MPDVFISYSRRNLDFVQRLYDALAEHGKEPWFDQVKEPLQGLPPASKWWEEIKYGIETADNFLFIISPASIASPYCNAEIAYALQHEKRLVTVLYPGEIGEADTLRAIDEAIEGIPEDTELPSSVSATITNLRSLTRRNWLEISQIQYVAFSGSQEFDRSLDLLIRALDLDLAWIKTRSQVRQAAQLWADNDYHDAYLWPEERLRPVREMIARVQAELSELEQEFIRPEFDRLLEEINLPDTTHQRRSWIGGRLCTLGDRRPGVGLVTSPLPPLTDEREVRLWGEEHEGLPDIVWLPVKGTKGYRLHTDEGDKGTYDLPDFYIAKYPVTYLQFQVFLGAGDGFQDPRWWDGLAASDTHKNKPGEQRFKFDNHPRESVSWYDAIVFCRWLNHQLGLPDVPLNLTVKKGLLSGGTALQVYRGIRLPTEWEWQWAATGGNLDYEYPWGPEWDGSRANTFESGLSRATAVGMYPAGAATCGALDMIGNVSEWCLNESVNPGNTGLGGNDMRVLGGGSWVIDQELARCAVRDWLLPDDRHSYNGFRVVCGRPPSR